MSKPCVAVDVGSPRRHTEQLTDKPRAPPATKGARQIQQEQSMNTVELWWLQCLKDGAIAGREAVIEKHVRKMSAEEIDSIKAELEPAESNNGTRRHRPTGDYKTK